MKKEKLNSNDLYVAIPLQDEMIELEKYTSEDSPGILYHNLVVTNEIIIVYTKKDSDGNIGYYNYDTNQKLTIVTSLKNFESRSFNSINDNTNEYLSDKLGLVAFVVPFEEFLKCNLLIKNKVRSVKSVKALIKLYSLLYPGIPFDLCNEEKDSWNEIYNNLCFSIDYDNYKPISNTNNRNYRKL